MRDPWEEIVGNSRVTAALKRVARSESLGHAYIFSGPEGCGKRLAALAFAREINCLCGPAGHTAEGGRTSAGEPCEPCRLSDALSHPELLILSDFNKPRWYRRDGLVKKLGLEGPAARQAYAEAVLGIYEKGYLEEPLPRVEDNLPVDGFNIVTDHLFGRGSVPSRESYTPGPASDAIRKSFDRGDFSQAEFDLARELYEQPLSLMPYRGTIHLAYITPRKDWKFTRSIQSFLSVRSILGGRKVVVIDDAEKMTAQAQNCLLKTLEEPPPDSVLVLVTSERRALFATILSRCQVVNFERLTRQEMEAAAAVLLGPAAAEAQLAAVLAENSPGKLLEVSSQDVAERLGDVRDLFTAFAAGRVEGVFTFTGAIGREAGAHRKKAQASLRRVLELVIFWVTEIARARQGLPGRIGGDEYQAAVKAHARRFEEEDLLGASRIVERSLGLTALNVDLGLAVTTTMLRVAEALKVGAFAAAKPARRR